MKKLFFSQIFVILAFIFLIVSFNIATLYQGSNAKATAKEIIPLHPPSMGNAFFKIANLNIPTRAPYPLFKCPFTLMHNLQPAYCNNIFKQSRSFFDSNLDIIGKFYNRTMFANDNPNGDKISVIKVPILRAINSGVAFYADDSVQSL